MKKLMCLLLLTGCASNSVTDDIIKTTEKSVDALEKSLDDKCITESVKTQFDVIKTQITTIKTSCQSEKDVINAERLRWKYAFFGLIAVMIAYFVKRFIK